MNQQSRHLMLEIILLCLHDWRERIPLLHSPPRSCLTDFHPLVAFLIIVLFFKHVAKREALFPPLSPYFLVNQVIGVNVAPLFVGASFVFVAVLSGGRSSLLWRQAPPPLPPLKMCSRFCYFTSMFTLGGAEWCAGFDTGGCSHIYLLQGWVPLKIWGEDTYVRAGFCEFAAHCEAWSGNFDTFTVSEWFFGGRRGWGQRHLVSGGFSLSVTKEGNNATYDLTINSSDDFKILAMPKRNLCDRSIA